MYVYIAHIVYWPSYLIHLVKSMKLMKFVLLLRQELLEVNVKLSIACVLTYHMLFVISSLICNYVHYNLNCKLREIN